MKNKIEVIEEHRPSGLKPFGSLKVNGFHIWRFDTIQNAEAAAKNLRSAISN